MAYVVCVTNLYNVWKNGNIPYERCEVKLNYVAQNGQECNAFVWRGK